MRLLNISKQVSKSKSKKNKNLSLESIPFSQEIKKMMICL